MYDKRLSLSSLSGGSASVAICWRDYHPDKIAGASFLFERGRPISVKDMSYDVSFAGCAGDSHCVNNVWY